MSEYEIQRLTRELADARAYLLVQGDAIDRARELLGAREDESLVDAARRVTTKKPKKAKTYQVDVSPMVVARLRLLSRRCNDTIVKWFNDPDSVQIGVENDLRAACIALGIARPRERTANIEKK